MLNQRELAEQIGISEGKLRAIETERGPRVYATTFRRIAVALKMDLEEAKRDLTGSVNAMLGLDEPIGEASEALPYQWLDDVPIFELSLAAGPWSDVLDIPEICDPSSVRQGLFRVRLSGDSMKPQYQSGMIIEFRCLRDGQDVLAIGKDYYVQKHDGTATFKRLDQIHDGHLVFRALNRKKYAKPIEVAREEIVRMAVAMGEFKPF